MRCHCEPRVTYRTPSRRCADDWWSRSPVRSHDVRVAPRRSAGARSMRTCDAVKLVDRMERDCGKTQIVNPSMCGWTKHLRSAAMRPDAAEVGESSNGTTAIARTPALLEATRAARLPPF